MTPPRIPDSNSTPSAHTKRAAEKTVTNTAVKLLRCSLRFAAAMLPMRERCIVTTARGR